MLFAKRFIKYPKHFWYIYWMLQAVYTLNFPESYNLGKILFL